MNTQLNNLKKLLQEFQKVFDQSAQLYLKGFSSLSAKKIMYPPQWTHPPKTEESKIPFRTPSPKNN